MKTQLIKIAQYSTVTGSFYSCFERLLKRIFKSEFFNIMDSQSINADGYYYTNYYRYSFVNGLILHVYLDESSNITSLSLTTSHIWLKGNNYFRYYNEKRFGYFNQYTIATIYKSEFK